MLPVCGALALVAAIVGLLTRGPGGALGAAAGVLFIAALFVFSTVVITWADITNRPMVLPVGMGVYALKLVVLFVVLTALSSWVGIKPFALGVVAGGLGWAAGYAWWVWHAKITLEFPDEPQR